jgi:transposase
VSLSGAVHNGSKPSCQITVRPQLRHEAIQAAHQWKTTQEFKERYAMRAGIEASLSQGILAFDLRRSRYLGLAKTHLQHLITAPAVNVTRLLAWIIDGLPTPRRLSYFAILASLTVRQESQK